MTDGAANQIGWLGHATTLIEVDGVALLTDPLLHRRTAHLRRVAAPLTAALPALSAVLLSHVHWDHLDLRSLRRVGTGVRMIVPRGVAKLLVRKGFADVVEVDEGDEVRFGEVVVRATHADHHADRGPFGIRAPALGFLVSGTTRVYFAGDTDVFDEMRLLADDLDVALLPVAGWGPTVPAGHMDAARAAEALRLLQPRIAIPIHWGTLAPLYRRTPYDLDAGARFAALARLAAPEVDVRVLRVGETTPLAE
jgi:L-ascorbate metabolism protein UlaG (beta-lactamase superfamily)